MGYRRSAEYMPMESMVISAAWKSISVIPNRPALGRGAEQGRARTPEDRCCPCTAPEDSIYRRAAEGSIWKTGCHRVLDDSER